MHVHESATQQMYILAALPHTIGLGHCFALCVTAGLLVTSLMGDILASARSECCLCGHCCACAHDLQLLLMPHLLGASRRRRCPSQFRWDVLRHLDILVRRRLDMSRSTSSMH
eukprot:s4485_g6.t1